MQTTTNVADKAMVMTVITLYEKGLLKNTTTRRKDIRQILLEELCMRRDDVNYWLDWFKV
jgi:hypothetical protein